MADVPNDGNFIAREDLANRLNLKVGDSSSLSIIYLDLVDFRHYVASIPEEHRDEQRKNALDHMRRAVIDEFIEEKISDRPYVSAKDSYRAGYDKLVICINSDVGGDELEDRLRDTVEGIISKVEGNLVPLVDGLDPLDTRVDPRKISVRAGIVFSEKPSVRYMLDLAERFAKDTTGTRTRYKIKEYDGSPDPLPP